ncbi:MAG: bifunctional nuclease family protein [Pyrinomonadaceae bacterium]|nr:bifunctional nuclease family protein [Pyrinomonadaceae bacterium]
MLIEVKIGALIMDPNSNSPIVVLKGVESENILPIWVGAYEANAIALEIEKIAPQRPMTHDLLRNLIIETGMSIERIVISDLSNNTFYARIELSDKDKKKHILDSRPSDAIALALRADCPIFVSQEVFDLSNTSTEPDPLDVETAGESSIDDADEWADVIE